MTSEDVTRVLAGAMEAGVLTASPQKPPSAVAAAADTQVDNPR